MKHRISLATLLAGVWLSVGAVAQDHRPNLALQREAMQKLSFLEGQWEGDAVVTWGPGEPVHIKQSEDVRYKLDRLVLLIEGTARNTEGKIVFNALATVSYDEGSKTYRFRSHSGGRYLETEIEVKENGFVWGHSAGPMTMRNVMHLNEAGEWVETTEMTRGDGPPRRSLEMTLRKVR